MTDNERMIAREQYFEEYRKLAEQQSHIHQQIHYEKEKFEQLMNDLHEASEEIHHRVNSMRRIVTMMLDTGCDSVEAKLKIEDHQQRTLWGDRNYTLSSLGATGAVGAAGIATISTSGSYNGAITVASASHKLRI